PLGIWLGAEIETQAYRFTSHFEVLENRIFWREDAAGSGHKDIRARGDHFGDVLVTDIPIHFDHNWRPTFAEVIPAVGDLPKCGRNQLLSGITRVDGHQ